MKKILVIDNYDSFVYNIIHIVRKVGYDVDIFRNDAISLEAVDAYDKIILSPGPGIPSEAGLLLPIIERYAPTKSMLGVCLGHQAIGEAFGSSLTNLSKVYHGVDSVVKQIAQDDIFEGVSEEFVVGRYHSWVVDRESMPECLEVTVEEPESGLVMALRHREYDVRGVQFHPESILTKDGERILENWLKL